MEINQTTRPKGKIPSPYGQPTMDTDTLTSGAEMVLFNVGMGEGRTYLFGHYRVRETPL